MKQSHGEDMRICRWNENVDKHQKLGRLDFTNTDYDVTEDF